MRIDGLVRNLRGMVVGSRFITLMINVTVCIILQTMKSIYMNCDIHINDNVFLLWYSMCIFHTIHSPYGKNYIFIKLNIKTNIHRFKIASTYGGRLLSKQASRCRLCVYWGIYLCICTQCIPAHVLCLPFRLTVKIGSTLRMGQQGVPTLYNAPRKITFKRFNGVQLMISYGLGMGFSIEPSFTTCNFDSWYYKWSYDL